MKITNRIVRRRDDRPLYVRVCEAVRRERAENPNKRRDLVPEAHRIIEVSTGKVHVFRIPRRLLRGRRR